MVLMENKRVFLAVNIPKKVKEEIAAEYLIKLNVKGLKPVEKENLHVTMKFLGYLPEEGVKEIEEKLHALKSFKRFEIELSGVGTFRNRVIWIGAKKGDAELKEINAKINELLSLEKEEFSSHLTLARNKFMQSEKVKEILEQLKKIQFNEKFTAESLDIMESKLMPAGPVYSVLKRIEFR